MDLLFRQALFVCGVTLIVSFAGTTHAGDFKRFPEYAYDAKDEVDIEVLRELFRQAEEMKKAEGQAAAAAVALEDETGPAPVAAAPTAQAAADAKAAEPSKPAAPASSQAGCMYRGPKLIWERVAGTCNP